MSQSHLTLGSPFLKQAERRVTDPSITPISNTNHESEPFFLSQISTGQYLILLLLPYYSGSRGGESGALGGLDMIPDITLT